MRAQVIGGFRRLYKLPAAFKCCLATVDPHTISHRHVNARQTQMGHVLGLNSKTWTARGCQKDW
jgi:hypothetical protein